MASGACRCDKGDILPIPVRNEADTLLSEDAIRQAAAALDRAEIERSQIPPLSLHYPDLDMDAAYAIQRAWIERKRARGARVTGFKIGLTSRAMQQAMHIDTPDYGVLLDDMAIAGGASVSAGAYLDPRIEAEFAFVLQDPLSGEDVTRDQVLSATAYVVPALELISARSRRSDPRTGYTRNVFDTIADNAAAAGYVLGESRIDPRNTDLRWAGAILTVDGVVEETGLGAAVMDHPAEGVRWVCRRFARHGIGLEPGQVILAGSFTRPIALRPGSHVHADYGVHGGIELSVT